MTETPNEKGKNEKNRREQKTKQKKCIKAP